MGLDLALGVIILIAAFRGWLQGFVSQAVRIAGLIACVSLAEPVRDFAKPHVLPYLPTIQPEVVDRLLWWVSAAVTYVVLVGLHLDHEDDATAGDPRHSRVGSQRPVRGLFARCVKGTIAVCVLDRRHSEIRRQAARCDAVGGRASQDIVGLQMQRAISAGFQDLGVDPVRHYVSQIQAAWALQNPERCSQKTTAGDEPPNSPTGRNRKSDPPSSRIALAPTKDGH